MFSVLAIRKKLIQTIIILSPIIAIGLVYFFNVEPLNLLKGILKEEVFESITSSTTSYLINQAIITVIINLIIEVYRHFGEFYISVQNKDRRQTTFLPLGQEQRGKKLDIDVKIDYRNHFIKWLFNILGGLKLYIYIPHWLTIEIRNKANFREEALDVSNFEYISFNLDRGLQRRAKTANIYLSSELYSNATSFVEDKIMLEIKPSSKRWYFRWCSYILIFLFFDLNESYHDVISSRTA
ncbi:hypothetical protein [Ornithinibacillus halotolerans]|uniref:Uncharacterized protein n=1 Tax=Ornithinibacillus halotolerans TaxID=1274357 RepID=A0A916RVG5_9BACI|nr:hypothetical protein [Ornithinibacillus halotolerans]GGA69502.1 hypothetical protein GCM10008025_11820 [Ornithinibacillus halotolerans]